MKKRWIILGLLLASAAGGTALLRSAGRFPFAVVDPNADAPLVRAEPVRRGDLVEIVQAPGTVVPETNVSISARVSAKIIELPFKLGQAVTRGSATRPAEPSVLVRLDSTDIEASLRAAQARYASQLAEMDTAKARIDARAAQARSLSVQLETRQTELERQEALLASNDVSKQIVDDLRATVSQLKAQIEGEQGSIEADRVALRSLEFQAAAANAEIDRIRDSLNYTTIVSPIDGVVTKVNAEVGEIAVTGTMNNAGTVILEVADLSKMLIEARVNETDIPQVTVGQRVVVRMEAYPGRTFDGVVQTVALARSVDPGDKTNYYEVKVLLDTRQATVVSGLTADVEIETRRHPDALRVPSQAVLGRSVDALPAAVRALPEVDLNRTYATVVYRLIDGKAVVTPVRVGASDLTHVVIDAGLREGDVIVVGPYKVLDTIEHEQRLRDERAATQPATRASGS